jgi:hypothetical protein
LFYGIFLSTIDRDFLRDYPLVNIQKLT